MNVVIVTQKPIQTLSLMYLLGGIDVFPSTIIAVKSRQNNISNDLTSEYEESINALKFQCNILAIPLYLVESASSDETINLLISLKIDLILSLVTDVILKENFIKTSRHGVVSSHGGVLPNYRGVDCLRWAVLNNDDRVGITTQLIDAGVDTGEIIDIQSIDLSSVKPCTIHDLDKKIFYRYKLFSFVRAVEMLVRVGKINTKQQQLSDGKQYFYMHRKLREIVEKKLDII
jgi:methionyl-tRNA formyltransferase